MEETLVSTVTPVYQGAATLPELVRRLGEVREAWIREGAPLALAEAIFVDDGSIDDSSEVLEQLSGECPWVRVVTLSKNFGQHPATAAGLLHTSGDWVATLDEDLQHGPEHITELLRTAVLRKCDVVYAEPVDAVHRSIFRDGTSRLYKRLLAAATGNPYVRYFNSYRMLRGSIARAAASVSSHETYFDIVISWFSNRLATLPLPLVDERVQSGTRSGYTVRKLLAHARRLLLSSRSDWLRTGTMVGLGALALSVALFIVTLVQKIMDPDSVPVRGWTSLFLAILFFGGLTSFLMGTLFEYLSVVILKSHGKPTHFVVDRSKDAILRKYFSSERHAAPHTERADK